MENWLSRATPIEETREPAADTNWLKRATDISQSNEEIVKRYQEQQEKYGSAGQALVAGLEGAASAATFGLSTGLETALGVDPEGIRGRREANPVSSGAGQLAGIVGSSFIPGVGAANLLERAGVGAAKAVGLGAAEGTLAKIGSMAVKSGVENAVFQGGDEVSKMLASDPGQSVETAVANIGLSGLIGAGVGGGIGSVSPLWKATAGGKIGQVLESIKNKAGGIDGTIDNVVHDALQRSGVEIAPEIRAGLSNDPEIQSMFKTLQQSDVTKAGREVQTKFQQFKDSANDIVLKTFGRTKEDLPIIQELSTAKHGKTIGETLAKEIDSRISPLAKEFEDLKGKYKNVELPKDSLVESQIQDPNNLTSFITSKEVVPGTTSKLVESVSKLAEEQGWNALPDSEIMGLVNKTLKNLPRQKDLKNLGDFISQIGKEANKDALNFELKRAGQLIKGALQDGEADVIMSALGKEGPDLVARYADARAAWKDAAGLINQIDDRLKIRGSTSSFARNVKDMAMTDGETLVNRLSGKQDADLLRVIQENFPETANAVKQFHLDSILKKAADKAKPGEAINPKALISSIDGMSPELRQFSIPKEVLDKTQSIGVLLEQFEKAPHNFSNTARTMDKLFEYVPATAVGMAAMVAGGNPLMAGALGALTKYLSKDAPDAVKLAMLKFMASGQPIEAGAFKATVDLINKTIKGENAVTNSVKAVFKAGKDNIPRVGSFVSKDRENLDKKVRLLERETDRLLEIGGETAYYLPEHATAMAETTGKVLGYLKSIRPVSAKLSPLDKDPVISNTQKYEYNRALDIAENPLLVLGQIKDGTLTTKDVVSLKNMYPSLYSKLTSRLMNEVIEKESNGEQIPYGTRMSLSLFLGQPLDSTMRPQNIVGVQPMQSQPSQQQKLNGTSAQKLGKISKMSATPGQAREMENATK